MTSVSINDKVKRATQLCEMLQNFISSNIDELEILKKNIRIAVDTNDKTVSSEEWAELRDAALALYDGEVWAKLGVCLWTFSRPTASLIVGRASGASLGLRLPKIDTDMIMKETKQSSQRSPEMPNIAALSDEDKAKLVEFLRTGVKK